MKQLLLIILFALICSCYQPKEEQSLPLHNKKVLILGNSITQNGKYVDFIEYYLRKHYPKNTLDIISIGLGSETASGDSEADHPYPRPCIHNRLDKALRETKPDLVLACYGMNDGIYSNLSDERFNNYKSGILKLKDKVEALGAKIIFLTPTPFDASSKKVYDSLEMYSYTKPYANYNEVLKTYGKWLKTIEGVHVIDLNTFVGNKLENLKSKFPDSTFVPDAVHPNKTGHFYMAKKVLNDLYPDIAIKDAVSEINQLESDSLFNLVSQRRAIRSNGWLRYIGYIRGDTVKLKDIAPTIKHVNDLEVKIGEILNLKTLN
jgi:lysophospholipase L1-like esterase